MNDSTQNAVVKWQDRIVKLFLVLLVAYLMIRGLAPSIQSDYLDRFSDAALGASILIILKLMSDLHSSAHAAQHTTREIIDSVVKLNDVIEGKHEAVLSVLSRVQAHGITRFSNPADFFRCLCKDAQDPRVTRYFGTAIRLHKTDDYGNEGIHHYDAIFDRAKADKNFCASRVVGVSNKAMLEWAHKNIIFAEDTSRFSVRLLLWNQPFSMVNMALIGDTSRIHKVYLTFTIARASDTFGLCIENYPEMAAYFKQYFDHIFHEAVDPICDPGAFTKIKDAITNESY